MLPGVGGGESPVRWCEAEGSHCGLSLEGRVGITEGGTRGRWDTHGAGWKAGVSGQVVNRLQSFPLP